MRTETKRDALVFAAFAIIVLFLIQSYSLHWDEGAFLQNAETFIGDTANTEPGRPFLLSLLIAQVWRFTGESTEAARAVVLLFGLATIGVFYLISKKESRDYFPLFAAFAFAPLLLFWSFRVYTDVPGLFFVLASLYAYKKNRHIESGLFIALATIMRIAYGAFGVGALLAYIIQRDRNVRLYIIGGLMGLAVEFLYGAAVYGDPLGHIYAYISDHALARQGFDPLGTVAMNMGWLLVTSFALLPGAAAGWKKAPLNERLMLVSYAVFILATSALAFSRYWLPAIPLLLLMNYRAIDRDSFILVAGSTIIITAAIVGGEFALQAACDPPFREAIEYVKNSEDPVAVGDNWAVAGYLLDTKIYAPWAPYETLRNEHGVTYVISPEALPYTLERTFSNSCVTYYVYNLRSPDPT